MADVREVAINFEAKKVALQQSKDGIMLKLSIHPSDMREELWQHHIGARYQVVVVEIGDDEQPKVMQPKQEPPAERATPEKSAPRKARERCVMLCKESGFEAWLRLKRGPLANGKTIEQIVREALGANSRSEIETDPRVFQRWKQIDGAYRDYQQYGDRA